MTNTTIKAMVLGVTLSILAVAVPATAEAAVDAEMSFVSQTADPCIAGNCRVTYKDTSSNPGNQSYKVQFDCDVPRGQSFASDSGSGRPPGSSFTCSYAKEGMFLLAMRVLGPCTDCTLTTDVTVASRAEAPASIVYSGPSTFPSLPGTFELVTPKRQIYLEGVTDRFIRPTPVSSRFDGQQWHHTFRLWVAPIGRFDLTAKAWNTDESLADIRDISMRVLQASAFPRRGFRVRVPCERSARKLQCTQRFKYYAAKSNVVRFKARFQAKVRGHWRTIAKGRSRHDGEGAYFELVQEKTYHPKLKRRYRHKPIRARFSYRVTSRGKTVFKKRTRYKRIRVSP